MAKKAKSITDAEAAKIAEALEWLEKFSQGDSKNAAKARIVCGLIRGMETVLEKDTHADRIKIALDALKSAK